MASDGQRPLLWELLAKDEGDVVHPVDRLNAEILGAYNAASQKLQFPSGSVRSGGSAQHETRVPSQGEGQRKPPRRKPARRKPAQKPVQKPIQKPVQELARPETQQQEPHVWFANVFQRFYGAGVGEPGGYQYSIAQDPQTGLRQVRIFQDQSDTARSFVFVQQPDGTWELRSGSGKPIVGNVHYDPKQRRFFALGVSEDDILKALQQSDEGQQEQRQQNPKEGQDKALPPGVVTSFQLGDGSVFTVSVDGMARVLRPLGNNQWAVVMERPLQELLSTQQPSAGTQSSEQIPSWMLLLMTLFLLMGRR